MEDAGKGFGYKGGKGASSEHTGQNFKPADAAAAKKTFTADFDFEQSNKRLDKDALAQELQKVWAVPQLKACPSETRTHTLSRY